MRKISTIFLLMIGVIVVVTGQDLQVPYGQFMKGYAKLDATLVGSAYTKEAAVTYLYNKGNPTSVIGRDSIRASFDRMFDRVKSEDEKLTIEFKITSRVKQSPYTLDNGFYYLKASSQDGMRHNYGRFSIVLQVEDGQWRYMVDGNSGATEEEWKNANAVEHYINN